MSQEVAQLVDRIMNGDVAGAEDLSNEILRQKVMDRIDDLRADVLNNPYQPSEEE